MQEDRREQEIQLDRHCGSVARLIMGCAVQGPGCGLHAASGGKGGGAS